MRHEVSSLQVIMTTAQVSTVCGHEYIYDNLKSLKALR